MSDDDQTTPLPREDAASDRIPTRPVPPEPDPSRGEAAPDVPGPARTPFLRRTGVRVTAAVAGGILLVGAGMGIGWGLGSADRGWDLAAQSGPGPHHLDGHDGMPGRDGDGFGPDGQEHGGPGAGRPDRDVESGADDDADADNSPRTPSPSPTSAG